MPSILDVAREAGVSSATVSHVLNGTRPVAPATQERVRDAVESVGYRRNLAARSLRTSTSSTIGMIVPDAANPFFAELARGVENAAFEADYRVLLCNSDDDSTKEARYVETLIENLAAGAVIIPTDDNTKLVEALNERNIAVVVVDRALSDIEVDSVIPTHIQGAKQATQYLIELGHNNIACIASRSGGTAASQRLEGFEQATSGRATQTHVRYGDFHYDSGYRCANELLRLQPRPTAIFACNDLMAIGALRAANEQGLEVPEDISIIGFDNIEAARYTNPTLTTVAQPLQEIGAQAARLLLARIADKTRSVTSMEISTQLVVRESTGFHRSSKRPMDCQRGGGCEA